MKHCDGCDALQVDVKSYIITHIDDEEYPAQYCSECADLARENWTGDTLAIRTA